MLARNLVLLVPGLAIGALAAVVQAALATVPDRGDAASLAVWILADVTQVIAAIVTISYTTGMADAAWRTGRATFADGFGAFRSEGGHVLVAMIGLVVLGLAAALLAPYTLSLSFAVYVFGCIFTMPAAVVGERPGLLAIGESFRLAVTRPVTTLVTTVAIVAIAAGMSFVATNSAAVPFVGPLLSDFIVEMVVAYAMLVVVGEYREMRGLGSPA